MGCSSSKAQSENPFDLDDANNTSSIRGSKADLKGDKFQFVIVGFGVAAGYAASRLAELGVRDFDVAIVGEEPTFAYERPALTKGYLFPPGIQDKPARLPKFHTCVGTGGGCQTEEWYQERNWTCYLSTKVLNIDAKKKILRCQGPNNEEWIRYEKLIVCTGSKPNKLTCPGSDLKNIYYLRNEADAALLVRKMERETGNRFVDRKLAPMKGKSGVLQSTRRLGKDEQLEMMKDEENEEEKSYNQAVILGAGYIGVEVACAMQGWGFDEIHLVFRQPKILTNMPWPDQFREKVQAEILRRAPNIKLHPNCTVEKLLPREESAQALGSVTLTDGTNIESHILVSAIGATPCGKELFTKKAVTIVNNNLAVDENLRLKSSETKDVWICGELAYSECGVEAARKMGKYAGESAFNDHMMAASTLPPYANPNPFHYSRLFEYTKSPLIWNQTGVLHGVDLQSKFCGENNQAGESGPFAMFFHPKDSSTLKAALVCGSSTDKEFMETIRKMVESGGATVDAAVNEFTSRGYAM